MIDLRSRTPRTPSKYHPFRIGRNSAGGHPDHARRLRPVGGQSASIGLWRRLGWRPISATMNSILSAMVALSGRWIPEHR